MGSVDWVSLDALIHYPDQTFLIMIRLSIQIVTNDSEA
jgi:hypothetical protein